MPVDGRQLRCGDGRDRDGELVGVGCSSICSPSTTASSVRGVDGGRVAEAGTHDELVAAGGTYARLWAVQTGEA